MIKKIKNLPKFFKEIREEIKKVNWSSREELMAAGVIVVVTSVVMTLYIFVLDLGLSRAIQLLLQ